MSGPKRMSAIATVVWVALAVLGVGTANADPTGGNFSRLISADCGSGPVTMVANGIGDWHAAQVVGSTAVFIAVAVEDSGVFYDPLGGAHPFSHPLTSKGAADPNGKTIVTCSFSVDTTFRDGSRLVASGTLIGYFT